MDKNPDVKNNKTAKEPSTPKDVKAAKHAKRAKRYLVIGVTLALFNYGFYSILANLIINNNNYLWLSNLIATTATTILAFVLHSKITWKERNPGKLGIYKFFIWNAILAFLISPFLTQLFSLITPLYQLAYNISNAMHLPFSYEFIQSTGAFLFTAVITTILNYFCYDRFIFGKPKESKS